MCVRRKRSNEEKRATNSPRAQLGRIEEVNRRDLAIWHGAVNCGHPVTGGMTMAGASLRLVEPRLATVD